jgi:hypothetical protein
MLIYVNIPIIELLTIFEKFCRFSFANGTKKVNIGIDPK